MVFSALEILICELHHALRILFIVMLLCSARVMVLMLVVLV